MIADSGTDDVVVVSCGTKVPSGFQRDEVMGRIPGTMAPIMKTFKIMDCRTSKIAFTLNPNLRQEYNNITKALANTLAN